MDSATRGHLSTEAKKDAEDREGTELRRLEKPQERGSRPRAQRAMWGHEPERGRAPVAEPPREMARGTAVSTRGLGWGQAALPGRPGSGGGTGGLAPWRGAALTAVQK